MQKMTALSDPEDTDTYSGVTTHLVPGKGDRLTDPRIEASPCPEEDSLSCRCIAGWDSCLTRARTESVMAHYNP